MREEKASALPLLLDVRTLLPGDEEEIVRALAGRTPVEQL